MDAAAFLIFNLSGRYLILNPFLTNKRDLQLNY